MYNNPFMTNYAGFNNYGMPMQQEPKQPINNIFTNVPTPVNNEYFMAKMLKEGEKPEEIFVNQKTAFISLSNKKISIKETDGNITNYEIILPLDKKDIEIQELKKELKEIKEKINNGQQTAIESNIEISESNGNAKKFGRK